MESIIIDAERGRDWLTSNGERSGTVGNLAGHSARVVANEMKDDGSGISLRKFSRTPRTGHFSLLAPVTDVQCHLAG